MKKTLQVRSLLLMMTIAFILCLTFTVNAQPSMPQSSGWEIDSPDIYGDKISMVSATDGWIISFAGQVAFLYRWDGISWTNAGSVSHTQDIVRGDISMVSTNDGWISLGGPLGGGAESVIYRWDGNSWLLFDTKTSSNEVSFSSMDMISATDGWAAAGFKFGSKYYHWDGSAWDLDTTVWLPLEGDNDIDMVSTTDGWAVGFTGKITHWNGADWLEVTSPITTSLNSISMVSATDGWAVGGTSSQPAVILHWNGSDWLEVTSPVTTRLNSVSMVSATDGWVVGDGGVILHWDGGTWAQVNSPTSAKLNAVTMISATEGWITGYGATLGYEIVPTLAINYSAGAPGSYFTVTGTDFPPNATAIIYVNGQELGSVPTDVDGGFLFLLTTTIADEGAYFITASVNPSATISFILDSEAQTRPQDGSGTVFDIPAGIAFTQIIYLPLVLR